MTTLEKLLAAEMRERILQQQNDAFDVLGADLSARLAAAEARCDEYVAQNMRQAQRLKDLEARDRNWDSLYTVALERLEKCEAAIDKYQAMHNTAWMTGPCQCAACDAARAAVEEKE